MTRRTGAAIAIAAGLLAVVPSTAGTAAATPTAAARAAHKHSGRIDFYPLTEKVLSANYDDEDPAGYSVGDSGTWHTQLISADGTVLADATGTSRAIVQGADGLYTVMDNTDVFKDGTVVSAGLVNTDKLGAGDNISLPAIGMTGRYVGYVGTRSFQRTSVDGVYVSRLTLWKKH
jgi:hypothetical protein